jgi:hypothetical protein
LANHRKKSEVPPSPKYLLPEGTNRWVKNESTGKFSWEWTPEHRAKLQAECDEENAEREAVRQRKVESRKQQKLKREIASTSIKPAEIDDQLRVRGLQNDAIIAKYKRTIKYAALCANLPETSETYSSGLISQYLNAVESGERAVRSGLLIPEDEFLRDHADNEPFVNYAEAVAMWELAAFRPRWIDKPFVDWLEYRRKGRTDLWFLCETLFSMPLVEQVHRPITDHFVQDKTGKSAGISLSRDYDENELQEFLLALDEWHKRLLLYPRSFWKSSISMRDLVQWQICIPDLRCLVCTSTYSLSTKFLKAFKRFFETNDSSPSLFLETFPEFSTPLDAGTAKEFNNPMAHLPMVVPGVRAMSAEGQATGEHVHLIVFDDLAEKNNVATAELREKLLETETSILELVDFPFGYVNWVGTRWSNGPGPKDPYGTILDEQAELPESERTVKVLIGAAMRIHDDAKHKSLLELRESDVDLLWPGRNSKGSWSVLRDKMKNERSFRQQQMNEPVGSEDDSGKTFDEDKLDAALIHASMVYMSGESFIFCDTTHFSETPSETGDENAIVVITKHFDEASGVTTLYVRHMWSGRESSDYVANQIAECFAWSVDRGCPARKIMIEKCPMISTFIERIEYFARMRQRGRPVIQALPIDRTKNAKANRISGSSSLVNAGQLRFVAGDWWDKYKSQALLFDGTCGHGRKDDLIDVVALACMHLRQGRIEPDVPRPPMTPEEEKLAFDEKYQREYVPNMIAHVRNYYFGNDTPVLTETEQEDEDTGRLHPFLTRKRR